MTAIAPEATDITGLLIRVREGDRDALNDLLPVVYAELRRMASRHIGHQRSGHTLQPTALIHEAYIRLVTRDQPDWQNRSHFFAVSANIMRQVLVDHARRKGARKREAPPVANPESAIKSSGAFVDLLAVDEALNALAGLDPRKARILDLRIFGGLDLKETAEALEVSIPTIVRESRLASAWMARELASRQPAGAI